MWLFDLQIWLIWRLTKLRHHCQHRPLMLSEGPQLRARCQGSMQLQIARLSHLPQGQASHHRLAFLMAGLSSTNCSRGAASIHKTCCRILLVSMQ